MEDALQRVHAYVEAGADGIFVPGLCNEMLIVARISYGPHPYLLLMDTLKQTTVRALALQKLGTLLAGAM